MKKHFLLLLSLLLLPSALLRAADAPPKIVFILADDPREERDVATAHPGIMAKLTQRMKEQPLPSKKFPFPTVD